MTKKEPQEASQGEVLTRRAAMKRIAAGLAGVGMVVVAGMICPVKGSPHSDIIRDQYGDTIKEQYGDSAPK